MSDYNRLSRLLQLIARLRQPLGCNKHKTAEDFGVSVRSIERYFNLLEEVGFIIQNKNKRYKIASANKQPFRSEDHLLFTLDEAIS